MLARLLMSLTDLLPIVQERSAGRLAARTYTAPIVRVAPFLTPEQLNVLGDPSMRRGSV